MTVLQELENRLVETEERISALVENLENHAELENSLRLAGSSLREASREVKQLAESARGTNESLDAVLTSFRDAVEILQKSDPTRATKAVERIEERLTKAESEIRAMIGEASSAISDGQKKLEDQLMTESQEIRKSMPRKVAFATLAFVVLLVVLEIVRFLPGLQF